jgi:hypothetical protein
LTPPAEIIILLWELGQELCKASRAGTRGFWAVFRIRFVVVSCISGGFTVAKLFVLKNEQLEEIKSRLYSEVKITQSGKSEKEKEIKGEDLLQWLIAENSDTVIPWDQIGPEEEEISAVTVKREAGVTPGSADVLLLGSDKVLTIVEAKLSENKREIRRMLIGQGIEYAALLQSEWDSDRIRKEGQEWWSKEQKDDFLSYVKKKFEIEEKDEDEFWAEVDKNLREGVIRLIYACDKMPKEVRQTIEFLNRFSDLELYGLEVDLYPVGAENLVCTDLIGPAPADKVVKERKKEKTGKLKIWTEEEFLNQVTNKNDKKGAEIARDLLEFGKKLQEVSNPFYSRSVGGSAIIDSGSVNLFTLYPTQLYITVLSNAKRMGGHIDWNGVLNKLNEVGLRKFTESDIGHSRTVPSSFSELSPDKVECFKKFVEWFIDLVRTEPAN